MTGAGWSEINHGSPPWSHPFEGPPPPFKIASPSGTPKFSFSPFINSSSMHSVSQIIAALSLITAVCQALPRTLSSSSICPPKNFTTVTDFNVEAYMGKWFVQAQQPTSYLPFDNNFCVTANYTLLDSKTIQVVNYANVGAINSNPKGIELRGIIKDPAVPSKLSVGPKFLPNFLKGPYWIVYTSDINKETGLYDYAVIVGGSPTKENTETDGKYTGKCYAANTNPLNFNGNGEGMWIFSRNQVEDGWVMLQILADINNMGLDTTQLKQVFQEGCKYIPK